jgi:hypothetical protein
VVEEARQEVARRAGVEPDYVDRLVELGILTPGTGDAFSPGDVRRARWVRSLEDSGVPLEGMCRGRDGAAFRDVGPVELKGVSGTIRLHAAHRAA